LHIFAPKQPSRNCIAVQHSTIGRQNVLDLSKNEAKYEAFILCVKSEKMEKSVKVQIVFLDIFLS
jgi:hypothetical protein